MIFTLKIAVRATPRAVNYLWCRLSAVDTLIVVNGRIETALGRAIQDGF